MSTNSKPPESSEEFRQAREIISSKADDWSEEGKKELIRLLSEKLGAAIRIRREMLEQILREMDQD